MNQNPEVTLEHLLLCKKIHISSKSFCANCHINPQFCSIDKKFNKEYSGITNKDLGHTWHEEFNFWLTNQIRDRIRGTHT